MGRALLRSYPDLRLPAGASGWLLREQVPGPDGPWVGVLTQQADSPPLSQFLEVLGMRRGDHLGVPCM